MQRTFVVLGAAGGIGSALVRRLAASGHHVVAAGRDAGRLEPLAAETGAVPTAVDATRAAEVEACLSAAKERFGAVDGVANCVGSLLGVDGGLATVRARATR